MVLYDDMLQEAARESWVETCVLFRLPVHEVHF